MTDTEIVPTVDPNGELVASIPRDQLRSMFYLFAGKPDSRIKVFESPIHLKPSDIIELNSCVVRKLRIHNIDASTTALKVGYVGSEISEFGTWAEFENHRWQEPDRIEEIVVKWDFLVSMQEYAVPQRHTLMFRVSADMKPGKFLQLLSSGNSDEFDSVDMLTSPAFCRVDFINAQLSKELINVVHDWHRGRVSPHLIPSTYYWLKKRRHTLAEIFDNWLLLSWSLLLCSLGMYAAYRWFDDVVPVHIAAIACFFAVYSLRPLGVISRKMASVVFNSLRDLEGCRVVFEFTSGDKKRIAELNQENAKQGRKVIVGAGWNIGLNILASILYGYFFSNGG